MKTVRICEWPEAERMFYEGGMGKFVDEWIVHHSKGLGLIQEIKAYSDAMKCTLSEAKGEITRSRYYPRKGELEFELGPDYKLRKEGIKYDLYRRVNGIWVLWREQVDLYKRVGYRFFGDANLRPDCLCSEKTLVKEGRARKLDRLAEDLRSRVMDSWAKCDLLYQFCGIEIWREAKGMIRIYRKGGFEDIPNTAEAVKAHLEKHYERLDPTLGSF